MPPQDPQSDKDFLKASPADQQRYMEANDPDFAKASTGDKVAYLDHVNGRSSAAPTDQFSRDTDTVNKWAEGHPITGPIVRGVVAAGQTAAKTIADTPKNLYHAVTDPSTTDELGQSPEQRIAMRMGGRDAINAMQDYGAGKVSPKAAMSVAPEAIGTGVGSVAGGAAYGKMGEVAPEVASGMRQFGPRAARTAIDSTPVLNKVGKNWEANSPTALEHTAEMNDPLRVATKNAIAEKRALPIPLKRPVEPVGFAPTMSDLTNAAVKEGTASRIPTRLSAAQQTVPPEPQAAALARGTVSGSPDAALGRVPLRTSSTPQSLAEISPTSLPQSDPLGRLGTTAGEKGAFRNFMSSNPSALGRIGAGSMVDSMTPGGPGAPPSSGSTLLPEPRPNFPGEQPNYMASVPRAELPKMGMSGKPGAGTQMQQLGEPVLYVPNEAGYPGPRSVTKFSEPMQAPSPTASRAMKLTQPMAAEDEMEAARRGGPGESPDYPVGQKATHEWLGKQREAAEAAKDQEMKAHEEAQNPQRAGTAEGAARDTAIMKQLEQEHPEWTLSQRLQEAAKIAKNK